MAAMSKNLLKIKILLKTLATTTITSFFFATYTIFMTLKDYDPKVAIP